MNRAGVKNFYEPSPTPILFVVPCQHMLGPGQGACPALPLFLDGNATSLVQSPTSTVSTNGPNAHMAAARQHRFVQRSRQEGEQCVQGELVAQSN